MTSWSCSLSIIMTAIGGDEVVHGNEMNEMKIAMI